ncbi:hypothetical protein HYFRA_00004431 [Hymenoscyphus fraxineus]|uniref:Uncharacterized protein n=1 Tax=Hymenoscyphus fraxineus TaxID=746836 RepID=A0A9N9PUG8_9HELO|nr:hypothetical protein HYFRA_00004431 [Hymenoscyphus fraxineus]
MSSPSASTFLSRQGQNGSAISNTEYNTQDGYYDDMNGHPEYLDHTSTMSLYEHQQPTYTPPEHSTQYSHYANGTPVNFPPHVSQNLSGSTGSPSPHNYQQHQTSLYTAATVYPASSSMYPPGISDEDIQNPPVHDPTVNRTNPNNSYIVRTSTPAGSSQPRTSGHNRRENNSRSKHRQRSRLSLPPSLQAQRYIEGQTTEERMRLGLPRFADRQQEIAYYSHVGSTGVQ